MTVDELNKQVTEAIFDAELSEANSEPARVIAQKYLAVSEIEQKLAALLEAPTNQGAIARRGVVRAALRARAWGRALYWAGVYADDPAAPDDLVAALNELAREAEREIETLQGSAPLAVMPVPVLDFSAAA